MKLARAISWIGVAIVILALAGWIASHIWPIPAKVIRNRPESCWFFASRYGKLTLWAQQITPAPLPNGITAKLSEPYHMRVSSSNGLFSMNFNPDWPRPDLGWNTVQNGQGTVFGPAPANQPYNFTLRVRSIVLAWWVIAAIALIPMGLRGIGWVIKRRRIAAGRCVMCGYDLRASPERCPECGAKVEAGAYNPKT
jgi:hypothetical protein